MCGSHTCHDSFKSSAACDRYKNNQLSKGAYERKVDKYTRDLGKYAMRRERGTFAERHARLVGTATGLAIGALLGNPVSAAAGATAGRATAFGAST